MIQHCGRVRLFLALPSDLTAPRPSLASVGLEVFQKGHAIGLRQVRTPEVATIAVAGPRGVDETVLLAARCVDGKATGSYSRAPSANVFGRCSGESSRSYNVGTDPLCRYGAAAQIP